MSFIDALNCTYISKSKEFLQATMPVDERVLQPFGYLHGGATIALLETVASEGAVLNCADGEIPFAVDVHVAHRSSMRSGSVLAEARLANERRTSKGHRCQTWKVSAKNPSGDIVSEGEIICLLVSEDSR